MTYEEAFKRRLEERHTDYFRFRRSMEMIRKFLFEGYYDYISYLTDKDPSDPEIEEVNMYFKTVSEAIQQLKAAGKDLIDIKCTLAVKECADTPEEPKREEKGTSAHRCDIDGVPLVTKVLYKVLKDLLENDREVFTDPVEMGLWLKELEAQPGCFCYQTLKSMKREKE